MHFVLKEEIDKFQINDHLLSRNNIGAINCFLCIIVALNKGIIKIISTNIKDIGWVPNCGVPTKYNISETIKSIQDEDIKKCKCVNCLMAFKHLASEELQRVKLELTKCKQSI